MSADEHVLTERRDGVLVITSDESEGIQEDARACCGEGAGPNAGQPGIEGPGGGRVGALVISPFSAPGTTSTHAYNHYSLLGTIERFRGRPAPRPGDIIYTFDGAVRAVECALALMDQQPTLRLTVHAGELEFTAGSISGPAAETVAMAVNESPVGQVTVTGVVKDIALGSRLDLTAGPTVHLPSGEQLQLFLAQPPSTQGLAAPEQDA